MAIWNERSVEQLFPTRLVRFRGDDTLRDTAVARAILDRAARLPSVQRGELTGWQSGDDLATWDLATGRLAEAIAQAVIAAHEEVALEGVQLSLWANVLRRGDHFNPHTHANSAWSGVYYIDAGDSGMEHGGLLTVRDPRAGAAMVITPSNLFDSACTVRIPPRTGELILFPSWLVHWVSPYFGERPRISVSFNSR